MKEDLSDVTLEQAQHIVDHLSPIDQVRLLAYLVPRLVQFVAERQAPESDDDG